MNKKSNKQDKIELFTEEGKSRGFYSPRNRLNDLTGKEWLYWTKSVINKPYPSNFCHKLRSRHGGQKPPELCADLIRIFTKEGMHVLDPFAGVGGTLLGASLAGRKATGIEMNKEWIDIYSQVCREESVTEQTMILGDSLEVLPHMQKGKPTYQAAENELQEAEQPPQFDFLLTDVPYWNMDRVEKSKGKYKKVGEKLKGKPSTKLSAFNGSAVQTKEEWLADLQKVFSAAVPLLKPEAYIAVFIGDMYNKGKYHFLSADLARVLQKLNLTMKANLVWYDVSKKLHLYGYQYQFIPSMIHQNILIFTTPA